MPVTPLCLLFVYVVFLVSGSDKFRVSIGFRCQWKTARFEIFITETWIFKVSSSGVQRIGQPIEISFRLAEVSFPIKLTASAAKAVLKPET
jgi:hypothetical protein